MIGTLQFLTPLVFLDGNPLLGEVLSLRAYFELEVPVQNLDIAEQPLDPQDLLASLEVEVAKGHQSPPIIHCPFEVLYRSELVQHLKYQLVLALLSYVVDEHLLPNFILGTHFH